MILVDTSVWIDHFHASEKHLVALLTAGAVRMHPAVIGELAVGNLSDRSTTLRDLGLLPAIRGASDSEVLAMIEAHMLFGRGIGWVDMHLLAAALAAGTRIWVRDKRTLAAATELGVAYEPR
ncbi:type II toxin-antitoxin system VapC family toxin [Jatrophihabitans fulvus]